MDDPNYLHRHIEHISGSRPGLLTSAGALDSTQPSSELRRVLFVCYSFPPNIEMGALTCSQIARYLPMYGWRPVVLTVKEKYYEERYLDRTNRASLHSSVDTIVRTSVLPHPLDAYRWFKTSYLAGKTALTDRWRATAALTESRRHQSTNGRSRFHELLFSMLCIPDIYTGWLIPAMINGLRAIRQTNVKAIFSSAPFFTQHLVGYALAHMTGLPWIAHFRDPWATGQLDGAFTTDLSAGINSKLERMTVSRANSVICVTEEHAALMRSTYHQMRASKFVAVMNGFDGEEWEEIGEALRRSAQMADEGRRKFRITYAGKLYMKRDPTPLFRALRALIDTGEMDREDLNVELIGWCETIEGQSLTNLVSEIGLDDCVSVVGPLNHFDTLRRLSQSDLLLLLAELWVIQIPAKTYEYLKTGRPILALTYEGALANLLRQTGGGWAVAPNNQAGIVAAVRECYQTWKTGSPHRAPITSVVESFDRRRTTERIAELLNSLTS